MTVPASEVVDVSTDPAVFSRRRRALGWGLRCPQVLVGVDLGRDLVLAAGPDGRRDLALVVGLPNLVQGLELALTTGLGDDVFNTGFGFDGVRVLTEPDDPGIARERVRVAVIDTVRRDPRVRRIVDLQLLDGRLEPGAPAGGPDPVLRRTAAIACAFEATSGDPVSVTVEGVLGHA